MVSATPRNPRILGLQPRDRAAMWRVKTIEFFSLEEFTRKKSLVPRGEKWFNLFLTINISAATTRANQESFEYLQEPLLI